MSASAKCLPKVSAPRQTAKWRAYQRAWNLRERGVNSATSSLTSRSPFPPTASPLQSTFFRPIHITCQELSSNNLFSPVRTYTRDFHLDLVSTPPERPPRAPIPSCASNHSYPCFQYTACPRTSPFCLQEALLRARGRVLPGAGLFLVQLREFLRIVDRQL
jgi:hypothetical protein